MSTQIEPAEVAAPYLDMGEFVRALLGEPECEPEKAESPHYEDEPKEVADTGGRYPSDLTGLNFGKLRVFGRARAPKGQRQSRTCWRCRCKCGKTCVVMGQHLKNGRKKSCGCLRGWNGAANAIDLAGKRFGRLVVIERAEGPTERGAFWRCRCDCGGETITRSFHLRSGHATSCGCRKEETQFQPGSNEPPRLPEPERPISRSDELVRDAVVADLRKQGVRTDGLRFTFADGGRKMSPRIIRNRIIRLCGGDVKGVDDDQAMRRRVGRIFQAVAAGLAQAEAAA